MVLRPEGFQCGSQRRRYSSANSRNVGVSLSRWMSSAELSPARIRASMSRARRRASARSISPCRAMTMRRLRPSMRACTIQTLRPDGWMRSPKPGNALSNRMVSLPLDLLSRARRGVRSTVGMIAPSLIRFAPSGQGRMDAVRYPVGDVRNGLVGKMGVTLRGLDQGVTEQFGDGYHVHAVHGGDRSPRMPKVMQPQSGQSRLGADAVPLTLNRVDGPRRRTGGKEIVSGGSRVRLYGALFERSVAVG